MHRRKESEAIIRINPIIFNIDLKLMVLIKPLIVNPKFHPLE